MSGPPDRRSDICSLAATAFTLLTGAPPTGIRPSWEGIDPTLAAELEEIIRSGLATDPARRPETAGELVERLRAGWGSTLPTGVLTFCVTDIEGSTEKWDAYPAEMARSLVAHHELVASAVEEAGGRFLQPMGEGDATVSVFTSPQQALAAALALTRAVSEERVGAETLRARVALHTGEAEQRGADYFGPTLNVAARVRGLAEGGQVLLSCATAELVRRHLPSGLSLVDLGPHRLRGVQSVESVFAIAAPGIDAPPAPTDCPYPGLLSFGQHDSHRFFGREDVVDDLIGRLGRAPFIAVVGSSGSGKSSLLRSGLAPSVGAADIITPGRDPLPMLKGQVSDEGLLVVDQFEELFTLCAEMARLEFVERLLDRRGPVVIGLRADFYGACAAYAGLAAAVAGEHLLLGPLTETELRRAITEPARLAGLRIEPGLVDVLVGEVVGEPGALPLLSHALRSTWEQRENRTLTLELPRHRRSPGSDRRHGRPRRRHARCSRSGPSPPGVLAIGRAPGWDGRHEPASKARRVHPCERGSRSGDGRARRFDRGAAGDRRHRGCRGGPRGAYPRMAAATGVAGGGTRRTEDPAPRHGGRQPGPTVELGGLTPGRVPPSGGRRRLAGHSAPPLRPRA